jgi:hypothetical protein
MMGFLAYLELATPHQLCWHASDMPQLTHSTLLQARGYAQGYAPLAALYESNLRRQLTIWGTSTSRGDSEVSDYANREWAGLIATFYMPRCGGQQGTWCWEACQHCWLRLACGTWSPCLGTLALWLLWDCCRFKSQQPLLQTALSYPGLCSVMIIRA